MREIKFRAYDTLTKKYMWPYPDGFCLFGEVMMGDLIGQQFKKEEGERILRYNDVLIEQFTGLHDKNGKEIYEGDIVKSIDSDFNRVIKWDGITPSFTMQRDDFKECVWYNEKYCEVIGNIHENSELLK